MRDIALVNRAFGDLNPLILGEEQCKPHHSYGPAVRQYTLIHFVISGNGVLEKGGIKYSVCAGQAFVILPGEITTYYTGEDPWKYQWIGFDGDLSKHFAHLSPVINFSHNWANEMLEAAESDGMLEYKVASLLFGMYAEFFASQKHSNHYIRRVKNYIQTMYMHPLRVESIAQMVNLDRRYLSRVFKERVGCSIQEYIIEVRMEQAKQYLENGVSVAQAARLCGYDDVCNFSKMFKRRFGVSPGDWGRNKR